MLWLLRGCTEKIEIGPQILLLPLTFMIKIKINSKLKRIQNHFSILMKKRMKHGLFQSYSLV